MGLLQSYSAYWAEQVFDRTLPDIMLSVGELPPLALAVGVALVAPLDVALALPVEVVPVSCSSWPTCGASFAVSPANW